MGRSAGARSSSDGRRARLAASAATVGGWALVISLGFVVEWSRESDRDPAFMVVALIVALAGVSITMLLALAVYALLLLSVRLLPPSMRRRDRSGDGDR